MRRILANPRGIKFRPVINAVRKAPVPQFIQIAPIMFAGIVCKAAFGLQVMQKAVYPALKLICHSVNCLLLAGSGVLKLSGKAFIRPQ